MVVLLYVELGIPPDAFEGNLHMLRILLCLAITVAIAFWMMAVGSTPGFERYDNLELVGASGLIIGLGLIIVGFVTMTYAGDDVRSKALAEHLVIFGLMVAAFGLGIYPFIAEKVFVVPLCAALCFAMARIALKAFRPAGATGSGSYSAVMLLAACGYASVWAVAAGWSWLQAGSFILVGIPAAFIAAFAHAARPQPMPAAG
ncbi:MAG TPA: hypothetical protein VNU25_03470 [Candidatus Paceibacterota bacterium]|nr:hypothetical protein [Candidatus Paceibacterota bacterium]